MREFVRTAIPSYLSDYQNLGLEYANKRLNRKKGKNENFDWHNLYDLLLIDLSLLTDEHCSYCDLSSVKRGSSSPTIDHFRQKSKFPLLAYTWDNLFLCCTECQKRYSKFNELLLKPDDINYKFDEYFMIEISSGEIKPNLTKSKNNQKRAEVTIELFKLNKNDRPKLRLKAWTIYNDCKNPDLDDFSYRFFIERAIN